MIQKLQRKNDGWWSENKQKWWVDGHDNMMHVIRDKVINTIALVGWQCGQAVHSVCVHSRAMGWRAGQRSNRHHGSPTWWWGAPLTTAIGTPNTCQGSSHPPLPFGFTPQRAGGGISIVRSVMFAAYLILIYELDLRKNEQPPPCFLFSFVARDGGARDSVYPRHKLGHEWKLHFCLNFLFLPWFSSNTQRSINMMLTYPINTLLRLHWSCCLVRLPFYYCASSSACETPA